MSDFLADPFSQAPVPGLLRYCAPVLIHPRLHSELGGASTGVVWQAEASSARVFFGYEFRSFRPSLADLRLDYSNRFGRHAAREWLGERGWATTEDRAEVLAWSVESVRRGGKPIVGVAGPWVDIGAYRRAKGFRSSDPNWQIWGRARPGSDSSTPLLGHVQTAKPEWQEDAGWTIQPLGGFSIEEVPHGPEGGEAGKAACDAALLALGWALTNADGSLTLPPLPEPR